MPSHDPISELPTGNHYDKYSSRNPIEQRMMKGFFQSLDAVLDRVTPQNVLEVGAGEGEVLVRVMQRFPSAVVRGIDLPDDGLAEIWTQRGLPIAVGDATSLEFADRSFDLVMAIEVLEHIPDPARALREIARVASSDVVLSVPREPIWRMGNMARGRYLGDLGNTPGHVNHWSSRSFERFVATEFDVAQVFRPLPWTMVHATIRHLG